MKREFAITLSVAAIAVTLLSPQLAQARTLDDSKPSPDDPSSTMAMQQKAQTMVPAQAVLKQTLDSRKVEPGQQLRIELSRTVQLKNGSELPRGTQLIGTAAPDPANANDKSKIELRFTQAELKGGKVMPITATIVGVYGPVGQDDEGHLITPGNQEPNTWNSQITHVDQTDPISGVELQSNIASQNSGTLISKKKSAVKLPTGTEFALAIAVQ
ncbi:MAG: hypothetical protein ABR905_01100 [Terracidiphilus sp.]|jgi:hypothetical protein